MYKNVPIHVIYNLNYLESLGASLIVNIIFTHIYV